MQARPTQQPIPEALERAIASARVKPLPEALLRLLRMAEDDGRTMSELAKVVEQDPGLCARILSAANSPGLRRGAPLNSVAHCLTSLGTRLIRSIATCLALQGMFERRQETFRTDLAPFWLHSLTVAETARELAVASAYAHAEEAYLAGLLHDIGELLLLSGLGAPYAQVLTMAGEEGSLSALEVEHFGVDHAQVGTWMVDHWQFDFAVGDGILFHHASAEEIATAGPLPRIVWLAHLLASEDPPDATTGKLTAELLGEATAAQLDALRQRCRERSAQIAEAVGLYIPARGTPRLPQVEVAGSREEDEITPDGEIEAMMRDMALMQPLQRDLFGIDSDTELLLSLRESARILFDLSHMAFFLRGADDDRLSAARFGDQPVLFRHAVIRADATRCLVAAAAANRCIASSFDPDYPQPPALIDVQFARVFGTEGLLCVPLNGRERSIGVMVFGLSAGQYGRLKRRLPWVLNFGRIAALSIEAWHEAIRYRQRAEDEVTARFERQARRVVHEAGNPLGIIKGYLKVLDSKLPEETRLREEIGVLREEIDRVANIVRRLSEIPALAPGGTGTDVALVVREMLALYEASLFKPRAIQAVVTASDTGSAVACDRDSLKQILLNLWKNAAEAMPDGGKIEISINDDVIHNGRSYVELRIADNGPGIPAAALGRLFSTDQPAASGERGMGLSIVGALVAQIGASISCRSKPGAGSAFTLMLPCRKE
mgnify:CR=1 FL=1